ncbi:MAG: lactate utilization protein, partial [Peptococcaceae bacterium]|nr:lactate utilization protein [Peptococcaceae bacterium]
MDFNLDNLNKQLNRRGFGSFVCNSKQEAVDYILQSFPIIGDMIVGMGNSLTLEALGIKEILTEKAFAVYSHTLESADDETKKALLA